MCLGKVCPPGATQRSFCFVDNNDVIYMSHTAILAYES